MPALRSWIHTHPYSAAIGSASFFILLGTIVVINSARGTQVQTPTAWGGTGAAFVDSSSYTPNAVLEAQKMFDPAKDLPLSIHTTNSTGLVSNDVFDYEALLATISSNNTKKNPSTTAGVDDTLALAYSFIPQGLISTTTPTAERSATQQALYEYGNSAGSSIQSHEVLHRNDALKLKDQAEDRQNPEKAEVVRSIGRALESLGKSLASMDDVPAEIKPNHEKLAQSYIEIGRNLTKIPDAMRDEDFIAAIQVYNASVETFITRYVSVASIFSAHNVTFAPHEGGSVFVFTNASL